MEVRLEDLVAEPRQTLETLCDFLGEPFDLSLLKQDLTKSHAGRWKTELSSRQIAAFEDIAGESLHREGYD